MIGKSPERGFFLRKSLKTLRMLQYFKDVRAEMRHVSWPTRRQTITYTIVVIAISLATAVYLGLFDYLFSALIFRIV